MELITGLFILGLYKATEKIWEKGFDAAWGPVDEALKARFTRWAGKGKEAERRAAFARAAEVARANTLRTAADPQQAEKILDALNGGRDKKGAKALAEEGAKLMLFSATPDVPRLTRLCQERLHWDAVWGEGEPPAVETVAVTLSDFLTNLREALLDQEPYHDLIQKDMRRALNEILAELRPVAYDDEATYRYQVAEMYRQLEFVGIPELKERRPVTVEDIFIRLRTIIEGIEEALSILTPRERRVLQLRGGLVDGRAYSVEEVAPKFGLTVEEVRSIEEAARARLPIVSETTQVHEAVQRYTRLVILGDPGAGKTTLLKYLTVICAEGRAEAELGLKADGAGPPLPIFVTLREFAAECAGRDQDYCLLDYFYTHAREHLMLNLPRDFFEDALEAKRCLVCLDGLDEVWAVGQRKKVSDTVKALATRFPGNRYVVTSRIVGYEEAPLDRREFTHHAVLPLADDDIQEFVHKWYEVRERDPIQRKQKVDDLIATIGREPRIRDLARNPLLLTIIALVHRIEAELPHERVKLYDKCVTTLVDTWEEVKGLTIEEKRRPFYHHQRRLLERLAYELHSRSEEPGKLQTIKSGDLELLLTRFLMDNRRLGYADDPDGARDEAQAFVRLARGRTGLLVERGEGVFGFPHLTFQEYLAACDIENRCIHRGVDALWEEIGPHLHDAHWREVILLLLGSLSKYDEPPTLLVERILEVGEEDKFEPVLHRHLYLATRVLADRVSVADDLHRRVVDAVLGIARTAPSWGAEDAFTASSWLVQDRHTAHGLLSLACDTQVDAWGRCVAAYVLGQMGQAEEAVEVLLALARNTQVDAWVRSRAAYALGQLGHAEESAEVLLALTYDTQVNSWMRQSAAKTLGQLGCVEEKVLGSVLALARDTQVDDWVRSPAVYALGELGGAEEKVLHSLLTLAHDTQVGARVRQSAASALGQLGRAEEATEVLLALARDEQVDDWVRGSAAYALGQLGRVEEAAEVLLALTRNEQVGAEVRQSAAGALGQLGRAEEKILGDLLTLAREALANAGAGQPATEALCQLVRTEEVIEALLVLARDTQVDTWVRSRAAYALGQLDRAEDNVLNGLLALARDAQVTDWVRSTAAWALGQLGHAEEAVEVLLALAHNARVHARVRCDAANALSQLGHAEEAAEILLVLARNARVYAAVRCDAASALSQLGHTEEATEILLALARNARVYAGVRRAAAEALGQLGHAEEAAEILLTLARDAQVNAGVRQSAAKALGQLGHTKETAEVLLTLVHDGQVDIKVRCEAAFTLNQLDRAGEAVEVLLTLACDAQVDALVRCQAAFALSQLACTEKKVLDNLMALARDAQINAALRCASAYALSLLGCTEEATEVSLALAYDEQVNDWVRGQAAYVLGALGRAEEAAEVLLTLARSAQVNAGVRQAAARVLGQLGHTKEAVEVLLSLARNARIYAEVCCKAASALGQLGRAEEAAEALLALARDEQINDWERGNAASALGQLGRAEDNVLDGLLALARDTQVGDRVRSNAASALGQLGGAEEAIEILLCLAHDEQVNDRVRSDTASALGQLGRTEEAAEVLLSLAHDEQVNDRERSNAASALGQLGRTEEAAEVLLALTRDEHVEASIRSDAYKSLKRLVGGITE